MSSLDKYSLDFEEDINGKVTKIKGNKMKSKVETKQPTTKVVKKKTTLTIFTYMNFKRFGVSVAIDNGIKINILWFETHIKFAKI